MIYYNILMMMKIYYNVCYKHRAIKSTKTLYVLIRINNYSIKNFWFNYGYRRVSKTDSHDWRKHK